MPTNYQSGRLFLSRPRIGVTMVTFAVEDEGRSVKASPPFRVSPIQCYFFRLASLLALQSEVVFPLYRWCCCYFTFSVIMAAWAVRVEENFPAQCLRCNTAPQRGGCFSSERRSVIHRWCSWEYEGRSVFCVVGVYLCPSLGHALEGLIER